MATYKRGDTYWFEFVFAGQRIRMSAKTSDRRAARQIEAAYRVKLAKGEVDIHEKKPVPLFEQAMKEFLAWSEISHAAHPNTHKRYVISSQPLKRHFRNVRLNHITVEMVERYKTVRASQKGIRTGRKLRPATVNRELACLKAMFNHAMKDDLVAKNPVSRVKFLPEENEQMRVLTVEEQRLYLLAASQPLQDIAALILETGMRPEEVYRLRRENVHLEQGYIFNPYGKTKAAKRKIPLTSTADTILRRRLAEVKSDYLFPGGRGGNEGDKPIVKINNAHYSTLKRGAVKPFRIYDLRHTWATRMTMAGVDLVTLAALLGHSRIQMVLRYAHPTEEHQFQAVRKMESFIASGK
jgi:integrase